MYVPTGGSTPSVQAQELGRRLYEVVGEYQNEHPGMTGGEVGDAFKIGWRMVRSGPGTADARQRSMVAIMLGLTIAGAAAALFMTGGLTGFPPVPVYAVLGVLGVIAVVAAIAKSSNPGAGVQSMALVLGLLVLMLLGLFLLLARSGGGPLG